MYCETKTFDRRPAAAAWIKRREDELKEPGELARASAPSNTFGQAIDKHVAESLKEIGRTKAQVLQAIKRHAIANMKCEEIGSRDTIALATDLAKGRTPQTVANYLSHLAAVFAIARPAWGFRLGGCSVVATDRSDGGSHKTQVRKALRSR